MKKIVVILSLFGFMAASVTLAAPPKHLKTLVQSARDANLFT